MGTPNRVLVIGGAAVSQWFRYEGVPMDYELRLLDESTWPDFSDQVARHDGVWGGCLGMAFHPEAARRGRNKCLVDRK